MVQTSSGGAGDEGEAEDQRAALLCAAFRVAQRRIDEEGSTRVGLLTLQWLEPELVAQEAGLSVRAFEEIWPAEESPQGAELSSFEVFLSETFGAHNGPPVQSDTTNSLISNTHDLEELIRLGTANEIPRGRDWLDYRLALAVSAYSLHERQDQKVFYSEIGELYQYLLYHVGFQMKPPLTVRDLVMNVAAVVEGSWWREIYGVPEPNREIPFKATPDSDTKNWNLASIGVWAIVQGMTEPI